MDSGTQNSGPCAYVTSTLQYYPSPPYPEETAFKLKSVMHFYLLSIKCISPNNFMQDNALRIHTSGMYIYSIALVIMNECSNKLLLHLTENDKMFLFQIRFKTQIQGSRIIIARNNIKIKLTGFYRFNLRLSL